MRGVRDAQMASKLHTEEAYFSDPEELKDHEVRTSQEKVKIKPSRWASHVGDAPSR